MHTSTVVKGLAVWNKLARTISFPKACAYKSVQFVAVCGKPLLTCGVLKGPPDFSYFTALVLSTVV